MNFSLYRNRLTGILLLILCLFTFSSLQAQDILPPPNPPSLVVDKAGVLIKEQKQILEQKLVAIDDSSSNQICVVIVPTLKDYPIEDYAVKLFRSWGIGGSENNNGVLLLIAAQDRQVKIEVGYGLEGAITDVQSKSIIENDLAPNFQSGNYYRGIDQATTSLAKAAVGEYKVARQGKDDKGGGAIVFFIILAVVIWLVIGSRKGGGGGGGGVASHGGWALLLPMLLGGGRGGGGFGGGGGGFGGGGGGFGGFGGGMSGGGGASGSW